MDLGACLFGDKALSLPLHRGVQLNHGVTLEVGGRWSAKASARSEPRADDHAPMPHEVERPPFRGVGLNESSHLAREQKKKEGQIGHKQHSPRQTRGDLKQTFSGHRRREAGRNENRGPTQLHRDNGRWLV